MAKDQAAAKIVENVWDECMAIGVCCNTALNIKHWKAFSVAQFVQYWSG